MPLELVNTLASLATFVVIAATAIAALVQLGHARSSNQITVLNELIGVQHSPEYEEARHFVHVELPERLKDPTFRHELVLSMNKEPVRPETEKQIGYLTAVGDFYENMGLLTKRGFVDRDSVLDVWSYNLRTEWERLEPATRRFRISVGNSLWENFEYLVVLARAWRAAHPNGTYPARVPRITFKDDAWNDDFAASARSGSSSTP
jgi:hypothetical protein